MVANFFFFFAAKKSKYESKLKLKQICYSEVAYTAGIHFKLNRIQIENKNLINK
jgi:hypothetical protein